METISFAGDGLSPELAPAEELADCAATALELDGKRILSYGTGAGYTPLRELLAARYGVHPYRVWITSGWLQGFALLARQRAGGRRAIVEYPTYDRALKLLWSLGTTVIYAGWHPDEGIACDLLAAQIRTAIEPPALAYTAPTFHNPTGETLSRDQRWEYGSLLYDRKILVVEDDSYGLLRYEGESPPTLFELSAKTFVYSTSFSATIASGLRVGAFVLPEQLAGELAECANATYITPALLDQATVFEFLQRGSFEPHLERLKLRLRERRDATLAALERHVGGATWTRPEGGIFLLLQLPPGTDAAAAVARAEGVDALAGADFGGLPNTLRLNFAAPALDEIEPGIERLAAALEPATAAERSAKVADVTERG